MWALVWTVQVIRLAWLGSGGRDEFLWIAVSIAGCQGPQIPKVELRSVHFGGTDRRNIPPHFAT